MDDYKNIGSYNYSDCEMQLHMVNHYPVIKIILMYI